MDPEAWVAFTASVSEDNGPFPEDVHQKTARVQGRLNTVVDRVRRSRFTSFVARPRGNVVTCSIDEERWIVRVCPVNSDVPTGSEPRGVVSGDIQSDRPE